MQALVDQGALSPDQARHHPQRSLVTRAVQGADTPPAVGTLTVFAGDRLLLCSDGRPTTWTTRRSPPLLAMYGDRQQCGEQLVKLAHQAGAPDNVTVVVSDVTAPS